MKSKNTYSCLNIVKNYTDLPDSEPVQKFLDHLKGFAVSTGSTIQKLPPIKSCFISADSMKQAVLVISLCFGNIQNIADICNLIQGENDRHAFNQKLQRFIHNGNHLQIFEKNAKQYGNQYPFFRQKVFDRISEAEANQIFKKVKESANLYGVKIRKWPESYQKKQGQTEIKRTFEKEQSQLRDDSKYLTIFEVKEKQRSSFIIGLLQYQQRIYTKLDNKPYSYIYEKIIKAQKQTFKKQQENNLQQPSKDSSSTKILKITSWPLKNFFIKKQNE